MDFIPKSVGDRLSIFLSTDDFRRESFFGREFEKLVFPDIFGMVEVAKEFGLVLDIASDEGGVGVDLSGGIFCSQVMLLWVGESVMIILERGGEEEVRFLH